MEFHSRVSQIAAQILIATRVVQVNTNITEKVIVSALAFRSRYLNMEGGNQK